MRLLEFGALDPLRSQTTYHAIAAGVSAGAPPTLSLLWPDRPYVSIGRHRSLAELDLVECRRRGLVVIRRQIGGGPVYLDQRQLFFQITLPVASAPAGVEASYRVLLAPAVEAFRRLGVAAALVPPNDICVDGRKLSGTGMARIGDALVCVGNLIFDFDYEAMVRVLALDPLMRRGFGALQRRYLTTLRRELGREVPREETRDALVGVYAEAFGELVPGTLTRYEERARDQLDILFASPAWLSGGDLGPADAVRQTKVRGGARVFDIRIERGSAELRATFSVVDGRLEAIEFTSLALSTRVRRALARAICGVAAERDALLRAVRESMRAAAGPFRPEDIVECIMRSERGRAT